MEIEKKYHFYAAHRNETLQDKCSSIHGHTYELSVVFDCGKKSEETGVTILFSDLDKFVEPVIQELDHSFIINVEDKLFSYLMKFEQQFKFYAINKPTSLENLIVDIYKRIIENYKCPTVKRLELTETKTSKVIYTP